MFFVLWGQRKNSVSERGNRRSEVRFLIGTKKHLSLFRAQNLPSLISLFTNNIPYYAFFIYFTQKRTGDAWEWRRDYHSRLPRVLHMVSVHMVQ